MCSTKDVFQSEFLIHCTALYIIIDVAIHFCICPLREASNLQKIIRNQKTETEIERKINCEVLCPSEV